MSEYQGEDRRREPYANFVTTNAWDTKTTLAFVGLMITTCGGLFASWLSLNTQITTMKVTQELKFEQIEVFIKTEGLDKDRLESRISNLESTVNEMYNRYQRNKGG